MATPTIPNSKEHFFPIIYEGNGGGQRVGKFLPFTDQATVSNSCIFNRADNATMTRTPSSAGTRTKFTVSVWVKLGSNFGTRRFIFYAAASGNNFSGVEISDNNSLRMYASDGSGASVDLDLESSRTLEDASKWYHLLAVFDSTQSTASDRAKMYIDGDQITSFSTSTFNLAQDFEFQGTNNVLNIIGGWDSSVGGSPATYAFDGYMAEMNMVDGQALLPASFGITDTSTGRWIPKTVEPFPTTTTDIAVTVVSSGGNKYALDGVTQDTVTLIEGATYKFDQSDSSNSGHPLRFSTTSDGTHGSGSEYTTGVTTVGTPGSSGAYTQITVAVGAPTLYYYCTNHSGMGGTANTQDQYGTNGFRLQFGTSSALGDDTRTGTSQDFSVNNIVAGDQTTDSPTQNHATLNPNPDTSGTLSEGNLKLLTNNTGYNVKLATLKPTSGKYYMEITVNAAGSTPTAIVGVQEVATAPSSSSQYFPRNYGYGWYQNNGNIYDAGTNVVTSGSSYTSGDVLAIALDLDNQEVKFYKNNSLDNTIGLNGTHVAIAVADYANSYYAQLTCNFGQKSFTYTPPTGFVALQQDNLPETAKGVSGFTWLKDRDNSTNHYLVDSSRNYKNALYSNAFDAEVFLTAGLRKPLKGGFEVLDGDPVNGSGRSFVSWNWVANGGNRETNTNGSITSTVQANTTAGFSIVEYTATGSVATIGHGLSSTPETVWVKARSTNTSDGFSIQHVSTGTNFYDLSKTNAANSNTVVWNTAPTSTVFTIGTATGVNTSSATYIAYCWHGVEGFSKFGSYTGNGNAEGAFIYTGFKPACVIIKSSSNATDWVIYDNKRSPLNTGSSSNTLYPNLSSAEASAGGLDFLSNGFKLRSTNGYNNGSGRTYIYMAWAEHPFIGDETSPITAR